MIKGLFSFILHSHIPWVLGHGKWPHGTDWLNEATAECYIPIINQLIKLIDEGYHPHLTIGFTPILLEQLQSSAFVSEFKTYLGYKIEAAENDIEEFSKKGQKDYIALAEMWKMYYQGIADSFIHNFKENFIKALDRLQKGGYIEVIASAATHAYLPLLKNDRSINAQIKLGIETFQEHFSQSPHGIWLPECAYRPGYTWTPPLGPDKISFERKGIEEFLANHSINYFIVDSHLLKGGRAVGVYLSRFKALKNLWHHFEKEFPEVKENFEKSPYEAYFVSSHPNSKSVAFFTRDPKTALQVWSGTQSYPGDAKYLEFHKKKFPGGLRYWRITDAQNDIALKDIYNSIEAEHKISEHAKQFVDNIKEISGHYFEKNKLPAVVCAPFDTELFGHWWFEGPRWLYYVLKYVEEENDIELVTGNSMLEKSRPKKSVTLPEGSWGEGGFHYIWLNEWTGWTWKHIYEAENEFYSLYDRFAQSADEQVIRILKQLSRELLLLQSSDWQFLISTWSARDYAELRFSRHFENFKQLSQLLQNYERDKTLKQNDINFLNDIITQDSCFKNLDLSIFRYIG